MTMSINIPDYEIADTVEVSTAAQLRAIHERFYGRTGLVSCA